MFRYYCFLGLRSLKRNPMLTGLMILILAIGVAASVATLAILHAMSADPIPQKSDRLFTAILDNGLPQGYIPGQKPDDHQMSYRDVTNLLENGPGERRTALYMIGMPVESPQKDLGATSEGGLAATHDLFAMFDAPFLYGQGWSEKEDSAAADVVVLNRKLSEKLFGNVNPVGQYLKMRGRDFKVVGVLDSWAPQPRFYHYLGRFMAFGFEDGYVIPLSSAIHHQIEHRGNRNCTSAREPGWQAQLDSECTWFHFWFEMKSSAQRAELQSYLDAYTTEQRKLHRFMRNAKNEVFDVPQFLEKMQLIASDNRLSAWLAFGFLLLCLVNTIGLLLAKFSGRASEVGVRRALGASRRQIFMQFMLESSVVGLLGGVAGVLLTFGALALLAMQSRNIAAVAHMDWLMLVVTFVLSVSAAVLAGLLPTWRACQVAPAIQLKSN